MDLTQLARLHAAHVDQLRAAVVDYWDSLPEPETDHFWAAFEVVMAAPERLTGLVKEAAAARAAFVGDDLEAAHAWGVAAAGPELLRDLDALRVQKSAYEELCLAEANRRAAAGHAELRRLFAGADLSELKLHLAFLSATDQDAYEAPYTNIVALGAHAATLHHVAYEKKARPAQSMLVDAGATFAGYCSDITRTWVKGGGAAASAFAQVVAGVEAMQLRLCAAARPGLQYEELHDESHRQVAVILREAGISKLPADELVGQGITRAFFPHGLGHSLGLQCHDVGCALRKPRRENPFLRNTSTISERQCFTVEPGIYFIEALLRPVREGPQAAGIDWQLVDQLARLGGVRIEDDLVVGSGAPRNLTRELLPAGGGMV
jgi:Xaa-Pro dipeptidase